MSLLQQLTPGGRMVIPVGPPFGLQHLTVLERDSESRVKTHQILPKRRTLKTSVSRSLPRRRHSS
ncbi:MAG: hypothetical protein JO227_23740 [Acetobacteraceae bacterium]|nr:hypothetical protein [Acetobacteraceae bacterium]